MADVFISYASEDRARAEALANALAERGWSVWWDRTLLAGNDFDDVIESELDASNAVIVLWSRSSIASRWVKAEAREALDESKLVPVLLEEVRVPLVFRATQAENLESWSGEPTDPSYLRLIDAVVHKIGQPSRLGVRGGGEHTADLPDQALGLKGVAQTQPQRGVRGPESISGTPNGTPLGLRKLGFAAAAIVVAVLLGWWLIPRNDGSSAGPIDVINAEWQSGGLRFCRQAISGRYPIERNSSTEIRLDDFGVFFGPNGIADSFFAEYLAQYVDTSRSPWSVSASTAAMVSISDDALRAFERADAIKRAFSRGDTFPSVAFDLRPVRMDAAINQFTIDLAGQRIGYSHGPLRSESVSWPGQNPNGEVRLESTPPVVGGSSVLREPGPWGWFRVLDRASITPAGSPDRFEVVFDLGGRIVVYELNARSVYNPFRFPELEEFRCPEALVKAR